MADIRCPNCGRANSEDRENCEFCDSSLHPTADIPAAPGDDLLSFLGGEAQGDEIPDWLKELRPEETPEAEEPPVLSFEDDSSLEWLEEKKEPEQAQEFSAGTEDWISRLEETPTSPDTEEETDQVPESLEPSVELEAWLTRDADDSQWLQEASEPEVSGPPSAHELPEEAAPASRSGYEETLDWLSSLDQEEEQPAPEIEEPAAEEQPLTMEEEAPFSEETLIQAFEPSTPVVEDLPDWFAESLAEAESAQPESQEEAVSPFSGEISSEDLELTVKPDWISNLQEETETPVQPVHAEEDMPDWLQEAGESESPFSETAFGTPPPAQVPVKAEEVQPAAESQVLPAEEAAKETESPGWLSDLGAQFEPQAPVEEEAEAASFATLDMQEGEAVPEWLARLDTSEPTLSEGSVPAFIMDEETSLFDHDEGAELEALPELGPEPDWLSQIGASQELPPVEAPLDQEQEASLAPAELPGWLEAMRPSESKEAAGPFRDTSDERKETSGLLSGLQGILPAESQLDRVRKPPVYSIKLHLPQDQQDRVNLLKEMLEEESQVSAAPTPAVIPTTYILRLLILGAFILGAIFAFVAGVQQTPVPGVGSIPAEVMDLRRALDELSNEVPVLVAFDYQPASLPELETAALPVIDQLVVKGASIRAVSTNPTGPLLVEHMLDKVLSMPDRLQLAPPDFANLGYIPGGAAGLQAFVRDPAGIMRYRLVESASGTLDAWQQPAFNPADGLANFQLVLVITDNADTARSWIEQSGQLLGQNNIPLVMVVSAQIEPMVRPYYAGQPRQVVGFASGMMGGVFLENLRGRAGPARLYLDAYSLTLMVAVFLLVIGSLVNLVTGQLTSNKQLKGEGKA